MKIDGTKLVIFKLMKPSIKNAVFQPNDFYMKIEELIHTKIPTYPQFAKHTTSLPVIAIESIL